MLKVEISLIYGVKLELRIPCRKKHIYRVIHFNENYIEINLQNAMLYFRGKGNLTDTREFKKLRRQLQQKRHIKIELCVKLSLLRLFRVDHVVQNTQIALSLAWYKRFSCKGKE